MKPWLIFYGTQVALVWETTARKAYNGFIRTAFPPLREPADARPMPPTWDEVNVRPLRSSDAGWISEFDGRDAKIFHDALGQAE